MGKSQNYLGGFYYFTVNEVEVKGRNVYLIEGKHSKGVLPSIGDIKDGLIKMILFTNLEDVKIDGKKYNPKPVLKLTVEDGFDPEKLNARQREALELLHKEAETNGFFIETL